MSLTVYLIRHGNIDFLDAVPGNLPGLHLSASGRKQAGWIAHRLDGRKLDAIYASPLERALETARPLARNHGLEITTLEDLREIDFGEWTGKTFDELEGDFGWKQFHIYRNECLIPGGDLMIQVQQRMVKALYDIYRRHPDGEVAAVGHHDPIKSLLAFHLGISLDLFLRILVDTGSISELTMEENGVTVKNVNVTECGTAGLFGTHGRAPRHRAGL